MSRGELLELLLDQAETNKLLQQQLEELTAKLNQKEITISNAGSIAEASLQLNGIFDAAQNAIQQYVDNVKQQWSQQEEMCNRLIDEAQRKAECIIADAEEYALRIRSEADKASNIADTDKSADSDENDNEQHKDNIKDINTTSAND